MYLLAFVLDEPGRLNLARVSGLLAGMRSPAQLPGDGVFIYKYITIEYTSRKVLLQSIGGTVR